jgi:hypothetical protein
MTSKDRLEYNRLASEMTRIRKKLKAGRATNAEKEKLRKYDASRAPRSHRTATADSINEIEKSETINRNEKPPEVRTELPGEEGKPIIPPPIGGTSDYGPATTEEEESSSSGSSSGQNGQSARVGATTGGSESSPSPNTDNAKQAQQSAAIIADTATMILTEFNSFNMTRGRPGLAPEFLKMFHESTKRMMLRIGLSFDDETFDYVVVAGSAGFVGYQTYQVKKEEAEAKRNPQKQVAAPAPLPRPPTPPVAQGGPINGDARGVY